MALPIYKCSQQTLYTAVNLGWDSCKQQLADFTAFSPLYNAALIDARKTELEAASILPDEQARNGITETLRIQLTQLADIGLANFQVLKRYIAKAFAPEFHKAQYEIAGQAYYEKAGNYNWDAVKGLLTSGSNYLTANDALLQSNQNMPPTFLATFDTGKSNFFKLHPDFLDSEEKARQDAEAKINANNALYANLISMFLDGQQIYRDQEAIRKQFIFDQVLLLIDGAGTAGVRGTVTDLVTGLVLAGVTIKLMPGNYTGTTDTDGIYRISPMASGKYTITYSLPLYEDLVQSDYEVKIGTVSTLNNSLKPL